MEAVIIAVGSNLGDRLQAVQKAGVFLEILSEEPVRKASVWESDPVGGEAKYAFLNSVAKIETNLPAPVLLHKLKEFEQICGREKNPKKWGPRVMDLDIICYGDLVIQQENLIIPHPEYSRRLFVLLPMLEVDPDWKDPKSGRLLREMVEEAPRIGIHKTGYSW